MKAYKQRGFTLIELMIALAIVGLIAAFAYPNYIKSVQKSRRVDAVTSLNEVMHLQEEYFIRYRSYAKELKQLGYSANTIDSEKKDYDISMTVEPNGCSGTSTIICTTFEVSANPKTSSSQAKDDDCHTFSINSTGKKTAKNKSDQDSTSSCWR